MRDTKQVRVDVVIPVYNEEKDLERSVHTLQQFLREHVDYQWRIVIADNASRDRTLEIAQELSKRYPGEVTYIHLDQKGRGRALRKAWTESDADILSYMDVDLSTDLSAFPPLINSLIDSEYDVAIGSRLKKGAQVQRGLKREIISRIYNLIIKLMFCNKFSDAQCGFKAVTRRAVREIVPLIKDQAWFFDSELLLLAERLGYKIYEVPVKWRDDPDSRVNILNTAWEDIKGLFRVRFSRVGKKTG
ncbi:MAG: glycosyltransferase family 2 protein [Chloroflexi bacterium]|nr:glycosyltransferase family 2 protein [Chloroflexota bacterium]